MKTTNTTQITNCFHCGQECRQGIVRYQELAFCCEGCSTVYQILQQNQLCDYYNLDERTGVAPKNFTREKWAYLDNEEIAGQLLKFRSSNLNIITLYVPGMHCTSCIYLLEHMPSMAKGIISSEVNFLKKEITVHFAPAETSLRNVVELLSTLGYSPSISLQDSEQDKDQKTNKELFYKIGVAGFCSGNLMILALPEYFDAKDLLTQDFVWLFRTLNVLLVLPVIFYSIRDYFTSAWYAIKNRTVNMELPIAIGLGGLIVQTFYDIITGRGGGYADSIAMFSFMLLVGRYFQQRTYQYLSFDRDFKSYFPFAITRLKNGAEENVKVTELNKGDLIYVRNEELIPADSLLESGPAKIDYSFVTGESEEVDCKIGQLIYAGGRNKGSAVKLRVVQPVSQSYLTQLWNSKAFQKSKPQRVTDWSNRMARNFTIAIMVIATGTAVYWLQRDASVVMRAVTSVLIVACPCVLALTIPFTFGAVLRVFGRNGFYLKNAETIEDLAKTDTIVFDKTGTLTRSAKVGLQYEGETLGNYEHSLIAAATAQSAHPVSRSINEAYSTNEELNFPITNWEETVGQGISAQVNGHDVKIGKAGFVGDENERHGTYFSVDGKVKGIFSLSHIYRNDVQQLAKELRQGFNVFILSGDNSRDANYLVKYFKAENLHFNQSPQSKLQFIENQQENGKNVTMIGDGLNDAGALKASNFGITVTDDVNSFTPASDAILDANKLGFMPRFVNMAKSTKTIIFGSFIFSLAYNLVGLSFAVRGALEPWVAALLMPISSITVLIYTQLATKITAHKHKL